MKQYDNQANRIRKEVLVRVARAFFSEELRAIDRIPIDMRPRSGESSRCCVYKDREVLKYRAMAALGFGVEDETDELTSLHEYYEKAQQRTCVKDIGLTVIDIACHACQKSRYVITDTCRGCLGRACQTNCPKDAIEIVNGRAVIDSGKCVDCGLCMKACPYNAVVRSPVPCEEICPVNAVSKDETGREIIDQEKCISCGQCTRACPFAAIQERSQMIDVLGRLKEDRPVVAMLAPSVIGQFPGNLEQIITALRRLGFDAVEEVATGADETARREAAEWKERIESGDAFMTTSCCPAYVEAVRKHIPEIGKFVSHTPSPMAISAGFVRETSPDAVTVFIGPCMAKRVEALQSSDVDYVLTFEELGAMLIAAGIDVQECEAAVIDEPAEAAGRGFAVSGGVTGAIQTQFADQENNLQPVGFDGLDKKALLQLKMAATRGCGGNFVEVMCCEGGCMSGPGVLSNPKTAARQLNALLKDS
ncbi:monomeric [FeFe] hydrogenase [Tichowtungia aerotolerans]|uniref:4Fe-4S dicluster domain-containing protein n=1 Tax=Tichowtungia aerotolerans TaxID=2697043 RepID=A0A6P1M3I2_9BACT|nr:monomeric [FeFe] hydrogenase [Tichowtungia aerotolerans]QHI68381.1 4Fe-4S dicluster domain-containing protein [Tichowtungia aerotolerans]